MSEGKKRFRVRKHIPKTLRAYYGKSSQGDGEPDIIYNWGAGCPKSDAWLLSDIFCNKRFDKWESKFLPSFVEELKQRGYDITTFEFSIKKKV